MATVSTYVNTAGKTEEQFNFYAKVFGTSITTLLRFSDFGMDHLPEEERNGVMHIVVPILGGHLLMGTDMLPSAGHQVRIGNNTTIQLEPDSREQADELYAQLSEQSTENSGGMADMDWGAYWGTCLDKYGIRWMINFPNAQ